MTIVPAEKSFFVSVDFDSSVKLSYASVLFNYQNLSPYKNGSVSYMQKSGKLLLWFYDASYRTAFTVPEGFLYYHYFMNEKGRVLIHIENKLLFVMQDHVLVYQSACGAALCEDDVLLIKKYRVERTLEKSESWHRKYRDKITERPLYLLLQHFLDKELFIGEMKKSASALLLPLAFFTGLLTAVQFGAQYYLQEKLNQFTTEKRGTQKALKTVLHQIRENKSSVRLIENYLKKYESFDTEIMVGLAEILHKFHSHVYYYVQNPGSVTLRMTCENIEAFLSALSGLPPIESYKLTRQVKLKNKQSDISLEIKLKPVKR